MNEPSRSTQYTSSALVAVSDRAEVRGAFDLLKYRLIPTAGYYPDRMHGEGEAATDVYWWPLQRLAGTFTQTDGGTGLSVDFGIGHPCGKSISIVDFRFAREGADRAHSGVFLKDGGGRLHLGHIGDVGPPLRGSRFSRQAFRSFAADLRWQPVLWPDGVTSEVVVLSAFDDANLIGHISQLVAETIRFRSGESFDDGDDWLKCA